MVTVWLSVYGVEESGVGCFHAMRVVKWRTERVGSGRLSWVLEIRLALSAEFKLWREKHQAVTTKMSLS